MVTPHRTTEPNHLEPGNPGNLRILGTSKSWEPSVRCGSLKQPHSDVAALSPLCSREDGGLPYSLPSAAASFLFVLLTMKQTGRPPCHFAHRCRVHSLKARTLGRVRSWDQTSGFQKGLHLPPCCLGQLLEHLLLCFLSFTGTQSRERRLWSTESAPEHG